MGFEDPGFWIILSGTATAAGTAVGLSVKVWCEKIRARARVEIVREALKQTKPNERPKIIEALAKYEQSQSPEEAESSPTMKAVEAARAVSRRHGREAKQQAQANDAPA